MPDDPTTTPTPGSDLETKAQAQSIVSTRYEPFEFGELDDDGNETSETTEIILTALGQAEWSALDQMAVSHYAAELAKHQKDALREFAEFLTPERVDAKIDEYISAKHTLTTDALPLKAIRQPRKENGKYVEKDGIYQTDVINIPYNAWFTGNTEEGQLGIVWLSAKRHDRTIQLKDIREMLAGHPRLEEACNRVMHLSNSRLGKSSPTGPTQTRAQRQEARATKRRQRQNKRKGRQGK